MRQKLTGSDAYTHVMIVDPQIEIHDGYVVGGAAQTNTADFVCISAGQKVNYWIVRFSFTTVLPGIGRKKIVIMDRQACGDFTKAI